MSKIPPQFRAVAAAMVLGAAGAAGVESGTEPAVAIGTALGAWIFGAFADWLAERRSRQ